VLCNDLAVCKTAITPQHLLFQQVSTPADSIKSPTHNLATARRRRGFFFILDDKEANNQGLHNPLA